MFIIIAPLRERFLYLTKTSAPELQMVVKYLSIRHFEPFRTEGVSVSLLRVLLNKAVI